MNRVDVSIVVPFRDEQEHIEESIVALVSQEFPPDRCEIIFVDNNSTDRSAEIVKRYPRVKLVSESRPGDFAARNCGISEAVGEIIAFTDSDTAPATDWVKKIVEIMRNPSIGVLVGNLQYAPNSSLLALMAEYESEKNDYIFSRHVKETYYGYTCNLAIRRELLNALGPFPPVFRNSDVVFVR